MYLYVCYGLEIRSEFALPEINVIVPNTPNLKLPVVHISCGVVPSALVGSQGRVNGIEVNGGDVLLDIAGTARYLVRNGNEIIVDPAPKAEAASIRLFLLGSVFGILCHQRGLLPLHANAIVARGKVFAFSGDSGAGKSTLATFFQQRGYDILCDDVCVLSVDESGCPMAWPGLQRLRLRKEALMGLGHASGIPDRDIESDEKYHLPFTRFAGFGPFPLQQVYALKVAAREGGAAITRVFGPPAYEAISSQTYRRPYLTAMGLTLRHFNQCTALLKHLKVFNAHRLWGFDVFQYEAEKLESHLNQD